MEDKFFATFQGQKLEDSPGLLEGLTTRPAQSDDVRELARLLQQREDGSLEEYRKRFENELTKPDHLLLVALHDREIVGYGRAIFFAAPEDAPANIAPGGWYLMGLVVDTAHRRRGIGAELTRERLRWIWDRATEAFCVVNAQNEVSIALHHKFGFREVTRDFIYPGVTFTGGSGILYRTYKGER